MSELNSELNLMVSPHATQVAGTVIATGRASNNFREKGVAYEGEIVSYGDVNDYDEMIGAIANGSNTGIIFSNHSYGPAAGWEGGVWHGPEFLSGEDPEFGAYTKNSKAIDAIAYFSKTALSIWSSGNEVTDEIAFPDQNGEYDVFGTTRKSNLPHPNDGGDLSPGAMDIPEGPGTPFVPATPLGFDTLRSTASAKNNLAIGNASIPLGGASASSQISISASSSRGPTDDGRIKPDLVADGTAIHTTDAFVNDTRFTGLTTPTVSGTSFSAPCVTGSLALLQELIESFGRDFYLSSTWKAILLNTAYDATHIPAHLGFAAAAANLIGPDYIYGWGACDIEAAANLIKDNFEAGNSVHIAEYTLDDGKTIEIPIHYDGTSGEMKIMIAWTDVPYQVSLTGNNETDVFDPDPDVTVYDPNAPSIADQDLSSLVNDVDLRVIGPDGTVYRPWVLDPQNRLAAATKAVTDYGNDRDNVEQVVVPNPIEGTYRVVITHKNSLKRMEMTPGGNYKLIDHAEQEVSLTVIGNKNPSPLLPELILGDFLEYQYSGERYYRIDARFKGYLGVSYKIQASEDLETWIDHTNDLTCSITDPHQLCPIFVPVNDSYRFFRIRPLAPTDQ